jgi:ribosome maturation factor RimP
MTTAQRQLSDLTERSVSGLGVELVGVERAGGGLLRVTIDRPGGVAVADCERVSRHLVHVFAVEHVDYARLEVSSPGVDRPLRTAHDFARFAGEEVSVHLHAPLGGDGALANRKRLRGRILAVVGDGGAARVRLGLSDDAAARPPRTQGGAASKRRRPTTKGHQAGQPVEVEFPLAEVDKARLVPKLDFRSGS